MSQQKISETDITNMFEFVFTIYSLYLLDVFCNRQSTFLWVPSNCCSLLVDWFLVLYRVDFMLELTNKNRNEASSIFKFHIPPVPDLPIGLAEV